MSARLDSLLERLLRRGHRGMRLGLERSFAALDALGRPHEGLDAIVVGGSNGKGSVCAMLDSIGREAGLRTGLYTSPHLVHYNERIRFSGDPIGDEAFAEALEKVFSDAPEELTFFETLTMAAFVAFRSAAVELLILEVGLGGRLDSTNVVPSPLATTIVSLTVGEGGKHLEHSDLLGGTVAEIAFEKAGILREGSPAIVGPLADDARRVILDRAREVGASPVWEVGWEEAHAARAAASEEGRAVLRERGGKWELSLPDGARHSIATSLVGPHQLSNAAVAAATAHLASRRLPALGAAIEAGLARASWPGRLERLRHRGVDVWLDCAHNLDGARALVQAAPSIPLDRDRTTLVFGALADKAYAPFLALVAPLCARRLYTEPGGRAPAPLAELVAIAEGEAVADPAAALERAIACTPPGGAVLVTGSIYLVGAVRAHLMGARRDPPLGL